MMLKYKTEERRSGQAGEEEGRAELFLPGLDQQRKIIDWCDLAPIDTEYLIIDMIDKLTKIKGWEKVKSVTLQR